MSPFLIDTQVRNLITDETARVVGLPDTFGAYPVIYDGETDIYWVSPHKLETAEQLTEVHSDPLMKRVA
jgi:hypothetical protein